MWADKVRYGFAGFRSTASPDRIAKSPVVDIAHARFRKNDCRVPQEKFRVQDSICARKATATDGADGCWSIAEAQAHAAALLSALLLLAMTPMLQQ